MREGVRKLHEPRQKHIIFFRYTAEEEPTVWQIQFNTSNDDSDFIIHYSERQLLKFLILVPPRKFSEINVIFYRTEEVIESNQQTCSKTKIL